MSRNRGFQPDIREKAKEKAGYRCERCGKRLDKEFLEVHHLVAIWATIKLNLPVEFVTGLANAQVLCHDCHTEKHKREPSIKEYMILAQSLLGVSAAGD